MAATEFTTWTAYRKQVLDAIVTGVNAGTIVLQSETTVGPDGIVRTFRNLLELERHVDWVANKVAIENTQTDGRGRRLFLAAVR